MLTIYDKTEPKSLLQEVLSVGTEAGASDIYFQAHEHPIFQIGNESVIHPSRTPRLTPDHLAAIVEETVTTEIQKQWFKEHLYVQFSHIIPGVGRYRFQIGYQRDQFDISVRRLLDDIPTMEELNLPVGQEIQAEIYADNIRDLCDHQNGLVVIAGATDMGKSTTMAAIVDHINATKPGKRITVVESPREFFFKNKKSFVKQKEIGKDILSYSDAATCALRENTNCLVFGETFDAATIRALLRAANSCLVFTTMHASSASSAINGLVYTLPDVEREESRLVLAQRLRAVIFQVLAKTYDGTLYPCMEILRNNSTVASLIRNNEKRDDGTPYKIDDYIHQHGRSDNMKSLQFDLKQLAEIGLISPEEAIRHSPRKRDMELTLIHGFTENLAEDPH